MLDTVETQETHGRESVQAEVAAKSYLFTRENAREMALKAVQARREKREREAMEEIQAEDAVKPVEPKPEYVQRELARTRVQIEAVNARLDKAIAKGDAKDLKFIADSVAKLREVERVLDGRPLPGSNKPSTPPRKGAANGQVSPLD